MELEWYPGSGQTTMEITDRDPIPKWDFQEPNARLRPWLRELSFWRHDTSTPLHKHGVKLYKSLPLGMVGRSLADQFSEEQNFSDQGFDLIVGAIRHHFRSYLEAEPEVQAEVALYQTTRTPKGTFVEFTSRISNRIREMESGFKECLPPKIKGFIRKRQAKLTPDQAKHLHCCTPTRGLEADRMVDALNRLDQTDALVEQIVGDRAKLEQSFNRAHAHTSHFVQKQSSNSAVTEQVEPIHYPGHATESDSEIDYWIGILSVWVIMILPWLTRAGQHWYLFQETDRWTKLKRVRCQLGHKVTGMSEKLARFCHWTRLLQTRVIAF